MEGNYLWIKAVGASMFPFYKFEEELLVGSSPIFYGCCVLAHTESFGYRVHRVIEIGASGNYHLKGDGSGGWEEEWVEVANIIGVVIGFRRKKHIYRYQFENKWCYRFFKLVALISKRYAIKNKQIDASRKAKCIKVLFVLRRYLYFFTLAVLSYIINNVQVVEFENTK